MRKRIEWYETGDSHLMWIPFCGIFTEMQVQLKCRKHDY